MQSSSDPGTGFEIVSSTGRYGVAVQLGLIEQLIAMPGDRVFMVDNRLKQPLLDAGLDPIVVVADEPAKSLDRMTDIIMQLRDRRATRGTTLVAIGGGVVQDVATFAASIYMRGIAWIYLPTTLLGMVDSCIGGKSSINVGRYKNIVGTYHPPLDVLIDPQAIATLSAEQKAAGLCEAAKICLCRGPETFERYAALRPTIDADGVALVPVIDLSLRTKKWFVEVDEFDKAERLVLNFGHTFGHAIEAATGFAVSHGIAVGLGMIAALHLGTALGRNYGNAPHIAGFSAHIAALLAAVEDLPDVLATARVEAALDAFQSDKKHTHDQFAVIVVSEAGTVERLMLARNAASETMINKAFETVFVAFGRDAIFTNRPPVHRVA
jgi:3-dehydroquinate synthase